MGLLPERFVHQVQQASDIVEVVGQYVTLNKKGKDYVGLCPFHDDHKPSMTVVPAKGIFKCFACGAGGGLFQFVMQMHKITFPEAVRQLAQRAGIPLPKEEYTGPVDRTVSSEALGILMNFAAEYFRQQLAAPRGAAALEYARKRNITDESIQRFGLGYAPDGWDNLRKAALGERFSEHQLVAAGLTAQKDDGTSYDRFRNRLIFPIHDVTGRIIAFGGRALAADEPAKYLNSPETVLFDKSNNLYALNFAHQAISKTGRAVVVEGYMDALIPHQAGVGNVVATLGTSLTERHVRLLARYAREVVLVFDADAAGRKATERAIELFLSQRLNVRVAAMPAMEGVKDPCDYVLAAGGEAFTAVLDAAPDAMEHAWSTRREAYLKADSLSDKRAVMEDFLRLVVSSSAYGAIDALRQSLLVGHLAELVGMSPVDVAEEMRKLARTVKHAGTYPQPGAAGSPAASLDRAERWLLSALMNDPQLFHMADERVAPTMFSPGPLRHVAQRLWDLGRQDKLDLPSLLTAEEDAAWGILVTDLAGVAREWADSPIAREGTSIRSSVDDAIAELLRRQDAQEIRQLKATDATSDEFLRRLSQRGSTFDPRRRPRL